MVILGSFNSEVLKVNSVTEVPSGVRPTLDVSHFTYLTKKR